jgi:hypothetical protein
MDINQLQCLPISAYQRYTLAQYIGPVTCTSIPWTKVYGGCTFSGDYGGAPLVRTGSCPTEGAELYLPGRGITSMQPNVFQDMPKMK